MFGFAYCAPPIQLREFLIKDYEKRVGVVVAESEGTVL